MSTAFEERPGGLEGKKTGPKEGAKLEERSGGL